MQALEQEFDELDAAFDTDISAMLKADLTGFEDVLKDVKQDGTLKEDRKSSDGDEDD